VVSSDNPGGVELNGVFGDDVRVVPREDTAALASAIAARLAAADRTSPRTRALIEERFRPAAVAARYFDLYTRVRDRRP
jgi:glycosyltransferase involved in cell wall biosynthesis